MAAQIRGLVLCVVCWVAPECFAQQNCGDNRCTDRETPCDCPQDCGSPPPREIQGQTCDDGEDNDCDGLVDAADPDCDPVCGDGNCDRDEDSCDCPQDCGAPPGKEIQGQTCDDGEDNDCDGVIDAADPDCGPVCGDGNCDRDEDSCDCPRDCGAPPGNEVPGQTCDDGEDNDCDGDVDAADADCAPFCGDGNCDPDEDSCDCAQDCGPPPGSEVPGQTCDDGEDNDCDGRVDAEDPDCAPFCGDGNCDSDEDPCDCAQDCGSPPGTEVPGQTCDDGEDNDCDGVADLQDTDCHFCGDGNCSGEDSCDCADDCGPPPSNEIPGQTCNDTRDNDCDGLADAQDPDCLFCGDGNCNGGEDPCDCAQDCGVPPGTEVPGQTCDDGVDNDCDGDIDAADPDCGPFCGDGNCDPDEDPCNCSEDCGDPPTNEIPGETCDDGLNNDCDQRTDAEDPDCAPLCGNDLCDGNEDPCNCEQDCGAPPDSEVPGETCDDGEDNDCDGVADLEDVNCHFCGDGSCGLGEDECSCAEDCGEPPENEIPGQTCNDGRDNDCDGDVDSQDDDCGPVCFFEQDAPPWQAASIALVGGGSSRPLPAVIVGDFELCSIGGGFGETSDGFRYLYQSLSGDFVLTALLQSVEPTGVGGLMVRHDARSSQSARALIGVRNDGGGFELFSSLRPTAGQAATDEGTTPASVELPLYLRIERIGDRFLTAYSDDGSSFQTHLDTTVQASTDLAFLAQRAGMMSASEDAEVLATAVFGETELEVEVEIPPEVHCVDTFFVPVDGGGEVEVRGMGLADVFDVRLGGVPAEVLAASDDLLVIRTGPAPLPGEEGGANSHTHKLVLATPKRSIMVENAVSYRGENYTVGDSNNDLAIDLADAVHYLRFLFLGGGRPKCFAVADVNNDFVLDLSDALFFLRHLFLGGPRPAGPFLAPGIDLAGKPICDPEPRPGLQAIFHPDGTPLRAGVKLGEGDVVILRGLGLPPPENAAVMFGDVCTKILGGDGTELAVEVGFVPEPGGTEPPPRCPVIFEVDSRAARFGAPGEEALFGRASRLPPELGNPTVCPQFEASPGTVVMRSEPREDGFALLFDRELWDPHATLQIEVRVHLPQSARSHGDRLVRFRYFDGDHLENGDPLPFEDWLEGLAGRIERELGGDTSDCGCDVAILVEDDELNIGTCEDTFDLASNVDPLGPDPGFEPEYPLAAPPPGFGAATGFLIEPFVCTGAELSPTSSPRQRAWCLFEELIQPGGDGLPLWEHFVPSSAVYSGALSYDAPLDASPGSKTVLFSSDAANHVINIGYHTAWVPVARMIRCQVPLDDYMTGIPAGSLVLKAFWKTESELPASADPDDYYSYDWNFGPRQYLTGLHIMESLTGGPHPQFFWATLWVPKPPGEQLAKNGQPLAYHDNCIVGGPEQRPPGVTGVWANYVLCAEGEPGELDTNKCGNPWGPTDECLASGCDSCHALRAEVTFSAPEGVFELPGGALHHQFSWLPTIVDVPVYQTWLDYFIENPGALESMSNGSPYLAEPKCDD